MKAFIISLLVSCAVSVHPAIVTDVANDGIVISVGGSEYAFYGDGYSIGDTIKAVFVGDRIAATF